MMHQDVKTQPTSPGNKQDPYILPQFKFKRFTRFLVFGEFCTIEEKLHNSE